MNAFQRGPEPSVPSSSRRGMLTVGLTVLCAYAWLCSALKVDDVDRYLHELGANSFFWDLGHLWMQPLAMLIYRASGGVLGVNHTLEAINVVSVALGCAVFYATLRESGQSALKSAAACAFVAASFNLITLGPTAHIKLMVFPALALALHHAMRWERADAAGQPGTRDMVASAAWSGVAVNLLVSVLPQALLLVLFMLIRKVRRDGSLSRAVRAVLPYAATLAVVGFALLLAAYVTARQTGTTHANDLVGFTLGGLKEKQDLHVGVASWKEMPLRFAFSLINNFAYLPSLGTLGRAYFWGWLPDVNAVLPALMAQAALAIVIGGLLLATFLTGARQMRGRPAAVLLSPWAFVLGAAAFSYYYNLNDPEHWFQFTMPVALLALQLRRRWLDVWLLAVAMPALLVVNLAGYGIPKARFALAEREQALQAALGPKGLYVGFAAYPGEPDSSLLDTHDTQRFNIDVVQMNETRADTQALLARLDAAIDATLARGGRVLVFRALDDQDWRGPVMQVALAGLPRAKLRQHLATRYAISGPIDAGGFPAYELRARAPEAYKAP